jgi:hypothetical protein
MTRDNMRLELSVTKVRQEQPQYVWTALSISALLQTTDALIEDAPYQH